MNVERSAPKGAVFLSYASQDAEAAKRICDALRAAGVEVWFDQSELVGGDQWDQKIRGQVKACALFIPIISAATQARLEGYFRLEWKLAASRTHTMADAKPFLLPVVIDATADATAHVPEEFRAVQWTRLKEGETTPAFAARVGKLLDGGRSEARGQGSEVRENESAVGAALRRDSGEPSRHKAAPTAKRPWLVPTILAVVALAGVAAWVVLKSDLDAKPQHQEPKPVALSPAATELARVRARLTPDRWQREDFAAMAPTLDRLLEANPELADAWAMRSIINSLQVLRNYDSSTKPLEVGKAAADRAMRLAPGSPLADIATGMHLVAMTSRGGDARACRPYLDRGVAALPPDALTRYAELSSFWFAYDFDQVQRLGEAWRAAEPQASFPPWIFAQLNVVRRRPAEAEKWAEIAKADPNITGVRAYFTAFESKYYLRAEAPAAWAELQQVPAAGRSVHRVVHARWLVAMADDRWDEALQELAQVPETFLFDRSYHGPKALLAGLAHQRASRPDAAAVQFREAERLLREHLAVDSDNEELHLVLAVALACAGRGGEARSELALVEPLVKGRAPSLYRGSLVLTIAQAYAVLGDSGRLAPWLRKLFAEPSQFPLTPASLRLDPRFAGATEAPEIQALLKEFAVLDQSVVAASPSPVSGLLSPSSPLPVDAKSVAVLAFANLSDDKANEYFSDGISEELLNVLAKIPGLKVSARTSAFYFKGKEVPVPEIAKQLGVAYVVEGSVRKQGDKVRITAQLIKAADGFHVWSDTFTRDLKDIFAVQDEIAGLIAQNLSLKMGMVAARPTIDVEAYQEYLAGRALFAKASNDDLRAAVGHFEKALAIEPKFTAAWVQLASAHTRLGRWGGTPTLQAWAAARAAIDHAVALEPDSPDVLLALGWIRRTADWDWRGAEQAFRRTLQLQPNQPDVLAGAAVLLFNVGKTDEAFRLGRRAVQLDPLNAGTQIDLSIMFYLNGNMVEAEQAARRALQLAPGGASYHAILAWSLVAQGRFAEAETEIALDPDVVEQPTARGLLAIARGEGAEARRMIAQLEDLALVQPDAADLQQSIAWIAAMLGDKEKAFATLDKARASRDPSMSWLRNSKYLQPLESDPRWPALLRKVGLADEQLK